MRCPTCKQSFPDDEAKYRPFCSQRCKLIDLGRWLDGGYAIPGEPVPEDEFDADGPNDDDDPPQH